MAISLTMPHEHLVRAIRRFGSSALEARQIATRLARLLPDRLSQLRREHWLSRRAIEQRKASIAHAERLALVDERYIEHLEEVVSLNARTREARVEYETHLMLLEARKSLRAFRLAAMRQHRVHPPNHS